MLLIVDAANVVGSVPDGWWRDRAGAARRLRDALAPLATTGFAGHEGPLDIVLVVEGKARGISAIPGVRVEQSPGSGDDTIAALAAAERDREGGVVVVTADRGLRQRVEAVGATVVGPRSLPYP
ncbi:hypothetical protein AB0H43_08470 [Hamadaea sp. NPDC050747]|uniref:hypothetical protein n=1 Tax=Hamadaea sp. NPDC050747 TaxID=3155789 RepID=UPI0033E65492